MTLYRITAPHFVAAIITVEGRVMESAPILGWAVGHDFDFVRSYCQKRGWQIEPLQESPRFPHFIEYNHRKFELLWQDAAIVRVKEHTEDDVIDIAFSDLPEAIRRML